MAPPPFQPQNFPMLTSPPPTTLSGAAALLDPRGFKKSQASSQSHKSTTTHSDTSASDSGSNLFGMINFVEQLHGVENRSDRPVKKIKHEHKNLDGDDSSDMEIVKQKTNFKGGAGTGEMGEYLKQQRAKLDTMQPGGFVDLTGDASDEEDYAVASKSASDREVCLGRIESARVNAHKVPSPKATGAFFSNMRHWPAMAVTLFRRPGNNNVIAVRDPTDKEFGTIDARTSSGIATIMDGANLNGLRLQARLDSRPKKPFDYPGQAVSDNYGVTINVYLPYKFVSGVGRQLSAHQIWLRDPLVVDRGIDIVNPHKAKDFTPQQRSVAGGMIRGAASKVVIRTVEETRQEVYRVFDTITESANLPEMNAPSPVITELLPHQKQALFFLNKRERLPTSINHGDNPLTIDDDDVTFIEQKPKEQVDGIWQKKVRANGTVRWRNAITGHEVSEEPRAILGGVLADVMGLGKTLTILSLVVGSKSLACEFGREDLPKDLDDRITTQARGTLLVCPLSTIVNWEDQIKAHCREKSIKYRIYQGPNRTNEAENLKNFDLVITTYQMLGNEWGRDYRNRPNKPLFEINWFRVVLDEAHQIRNSSSLQSKAACELSADRRWCVTGTPVQNRLEDLGALIKFLKISPFDEPGSFSRFISAPLRTGDAEAIPKLRVLVDTITLRRLKDKLDLPNREERLVKLTMSDAERTLYNQFHRDINNKVNAMAGNTERLGGKGYATALKGIGRLRMLCAHSGDMLSDEDWELAKNFDNHQSIYIDDEDENRPDRKPAQAFEMYRLMRESNVAICARCATVIEPDEELEEDEDEVFGNLTPCNQLLCVKCLPTWLSEMKQDGEVDNRGNCNICGVYIRICYVELKRLDLLDFERTQELVHASKFARSLQRYTEPATKTKQLLGDLAVDQAWSEAHPDEVPIKSVVFSEWTTHLDLIQLAFTNNKIPYTRLDGSLRFSQRTDALTTFADSREVNVILVSLKAGGLGLNLTAASRVYVMEPNYNPAAEQQAIERVHRLGQKRDVVIRRYIMLNSIEEKVIDLQEKKMALATFSVDRDATTTKLADKDKSAKMRKTLEDLRSLLR